MRRLGPGLVMGTRSCRQRVGSGGGVSLGPADYGATFASGASESFYFEAGGSAAYLATNTAAEAGTGDPVGTLLDLSRANFDGVWTDVAGWVNGDWDVLTATGGSFVAEKTVSGGTDRAYSSTLLPVVRDRLYEIELDVNAATVSAYGFGLSQGTNARSTSILTSGAGAKRFVAHANVLSGNFSVSVSTTNLGLLDLASARLREVGGRNLIQPTAGARPVMAADGLIFDGGDDLLFSAADLTIANGWYFAAAMTIPAYGGGPGPRAVLTVTNGGTTQLALAVRYDGSAAGNRNVAMIHTESGGPQTIATISDALPVAGTPFVIEGWLSGSEITAVSALGATVSQTVSVVGVSGLPLRMGSSTLAPCTVHGALARNTLPDAGLRAAIRARLAQVAGL